MTLKTLFFLLREKWTGFWLDRQIRKNDAIVARQIKRIRALQDKIAALKVWTGD